VCVCVFVCIFIYMNCIVKLSAVCQATELNFYLLTYLCSILCFLVVHCVPVSLFYCW